MSQYSVRVDKTNGSGKKDQGDPWFSLGEGGRGLIGKGDSWSTVKIVRGRGSLVLDCVVQRERVLTLTLITQPSISTYYFRFSLIQ